MLDGYRRGKRRKSSFLTNSISSINSIITTITQLLINLFVFAIVSGLLFNDPFGTIDSISSIISNIDDNGIAALISLLVIVLWYRRKYDS